MKFDIFHTNLLFMIFYVKTYLVAELDEEWWPFTVATLDKTEFPLITTLLVLLTLWKAEPLPPKSLFGNGGGEFSLEEWGWSPKSYHLSSPELPLDVLPDNPLVWLLLE